jgi:hypothetical protein
MLSNVYINDIIYIKRNKCNIRRQMIKGYMEMLTNRINKI